MRAQSVLIAAWRHVLRQYQHTFATDHGYCLVTARGFHNGKATVAIWQAQQVAPPALVAHRLTKPAHDGGNDINLTADDILGLTKGVLDSRRDQQHGDMKSVQI